MTTCMGDEYVCMYMESLERAELVVGWLMEVESGVGVWFEIVDDGIATVL